MGNGCHVKNNVVYRKEMKVKDFRKMALSKQYGTPQKNYDLYNLEKWTYFLEILFKSIF